jgi:hypothetical protein
VSFSQIVGTPVQISLDFVNVDAAPPPSPHPLGGSAGTLIRALLLAQLPPASQTALSQLLSTPLDQLFDTMWTQLQPTAQSMVQQAVQSAQSNAYNINATLPSSGTLSAQVSGLSPALMSLMPPGTNAQQLTLQYSVPGFQVSFSETTSGIWGSWADPSYNLSFDGVIEIAVAVPTSTLVPIAAVANFLTENMQASAGNFFAVLIGIEDTISDWLSGRPTGTGSSLQNQIIGINVPALQQLFGEMSSGFATAAGFGFLQLGVQINTSPPAGTPQGNTVEFDLTHAFDPGPTVRNALIVAGPSLTSAEIGASSPEVNAGGTLGVTGAYFPAGQATSLSITWTDTTSGNVVESEVQWGAAPGSNPPPANPADVKITRHGAYDNTNDFTASSLAPGSAYAFRVRDYDVADFIATDWGPWAVLSTMATDQVQLVLDYNNETVGYATLLSNGSFTATATVPGSVPPGTYQLAALLGGQQMASTTVTVIASGQAPAAKLQVYNTVTGTAFTGTPSVEAGYSVTLRGLYFNLGAVNLFIDSPAGQSLGTANAVPNPALPASGMFIYATPPWPNNVIGVHSIVAQQGALQASVLVSGQNQPQ